MDIVVLQDTSFENCGCIADRMQQNDTISDLNLYDVNGGAVDGRCDQGCNKLGLFLGIMFVALLLIFILQVPNVIITVRCVIQCNTNTLHYIITLLASTCGNSTAYRKPVAPPSIKAGPMEEACSTLNTSLIHLTTH